ncbi:MAG: DUF2141 domain-containing protein [Deltaproteobacteria bacterium]|nr:DUF2141 domain-containing protein [Deltaproteobacteria bacterium]
MTRHGRLRALIVALAALTWSATAAAEEATPSPPVGLTVDISNIQNDKGQIGCSLYSKDDGFPSKPEKADAMMFVKSKAGKATCVFKGLKAGKYAVSVMHDEDKDGELKTSMVGRPKEWWGVSNNVPPERFGPPKYEAALFSYTGTPKTIKVKLRL